MEDIKFPTEMVELPSKGLIYPKDHPLRSGKVEMKYMTAKEEDILTNQNLIEKGTVLERLLEALTMKKFDVKDIATGDKNAIFMGARILGYGAEYKFTYDGREIVMDLSTIEPKPFDVSLTDEDGYIKFLLPKSQLDIKFKILTESDEVKIQNEIKSLAKFKGNSGGEVTTRLKYQIVSIKDNDDKNEIKSFVENHLLAQDSRALRNYIKDVSPDVDLTHILDDGKEISIPISLNFFWPDL
mgnify:FL=1|jgi:hypothetical protein|tara:strand:- start:18 stop:740 length:723 start_codon:yes stop_codon:yes gene_type:complete